MIVMTEQLFLFPQRRINVPNLVLNSDSTFRLRRRELLDIGVNQ